MVTMGQRMCIYKHIYFASTGSHIKESEKAKSVKIWLGKWALDIDVKGLAANNNFITIVVK